MIGLVPVDSPVAGSGRGRDLAHLSDEGLLSLVASSDEEALAELYDRFGGVAYGLALRILRDEALAQDAVQEAFLSVWRTADRFLASPIGAVDSFLAPGSAMSAVLAPAPSAICTAFSSRSASSGRFNVKRSIIATLRMEPRGLAMPLPAISGALPCTGS